jgi:peptide-methionine (S)-S-oxide reductase
VIERDQMLNFRREQTAAAPAVPTQTTAPAPPAAAAPDHGDLTERATFAAGCFWGVEAAFRAIEGVIETAVGYTGGQTPDPSYEQVCRGRTGHAEAVDVWFDPARVSYEELLHTFWHSHNPASRNRQGMDFGSQYRSAIFFHDPQQERRALATRDAEQRSHNKPIATQIVAAGAFHRAEDYHQQYFEKAGRGQPACSIM